MRTFGTMQASTHGFSDDDEVAISNAARILGVSVVTVRRYVTDGRIKPKRTPGGHFRFRVGDLRALLKPDPNGDPEAVAS